MGYYKVMLKGEPLFKEKFPDRIHAKEAIKDAQRGARERGDFLAAKRYGKAKLKHYKYGQI